MRKAYSKQRQLDSVPIDQVELNLECRDSIIPVLRALQQVYSDWALTEKVLDLIGQDVNGDSRTDCGREGMDYWHLLVLASVRLGCNLTYDQLHDLSENHIKLRATMGLGLWDAKTEFKWRRIRDNVCLLTPETIDRISQLVVASGHEIVPAAVEKMRADSFVMETSIHYPTVACLNSGIDADLLSFEFPSLRTVPSGFVFRALQGCWACSLAFQLPLGGSPDSFSRVAMPGKVELPNINSESGSSTFEFTISRRVASGGKPRLSRQNRSSLNWNCNSPAGTARRTSLVPTRLHPRPLFLFARSSRSPILADLHRIRSQRGQGRLQFADG